MSRQVQITLPPDEAVLITGAGPAGLFAALRLIEPGIRPVIFERGLAQRRMNAEGSGSEAYGFFIRKDLIGSSHSLVLSRCSLV